MGTYRDFEMIVNPQMETFVVSKKAIVLPTCFKMPGNTPAKIFRHINGTWAIRYFCVPRSGDRLTFRGHSWVVERLEHGSVNVKGSPKADSLPIVVTKYLGVASDEDSND